ncbi:MAG: hypothetical protein H7Z75_15540 [Ferruginibacter sp.]|nr:hypothetical protein [Cytophagales bacterium]
MNPYLLFSTRLMLGLVWAYNGLWLKVLHPSPEHLAVVQGLGLGSWVAAPALLMLIGWGETLLAVGIWSGFYHRFVSWFQLTILLLMNLVGILFSHAIEQPGHLLVQNLPLFFCILTVARYGPGFPFSGSARQ